jgi:hypothetical protein
MIEVEITNYQSISYAKFEIEGFTTIVGRNSLGKSATLRAINAALTNQQGTDFIKWGETFCDVKLKIGDLYIHWHKEEGNNFYKINDSQLYTKIGRDEPPKEILDAGFKVLKIGDQKINLTYADQFNPLFLVDKLDSKGADLLTSVYGLDRLYKAVDLCNKAQRETSDELKMREKDLEIATRDLESFKEFESAKNSAQDLRGRKELLDVEEACIIDLKDKLDRVQELVAVCRKFQKVKDISLPKCIDIRDDITAYRNLVRFLENVDKLTVVLQKLKRVPEVIIPTGSVLGITKEIVDYKKLCAWKQRYDALSQDVLRLGKLDSIVFPKIAFDSETLQQLRSLSTDAERQKRELLTTKKDLDTATLEHDKLTEEKKKFKICPLCSGALN